jgi:transposase
VQDWARQVRAVYDGARAFQGQAREALARYGQDAGSFGFGVFDLRRKRQHFEAQLLALAAPCLKQDVPQRMLSDVPQRVLSERIANFLPELFVFVEHPSVPSENNAAERSVRPAVIARKISGGTRSAKGSATKSVLLSLFGTWQAQGHDPLEACQQMLLTPKMLLTPTG